jgi:hypothetical protein
MNILSIGESVYIDCIDGFGGPAKVVDVRESPTNKYMVLMDDLNPIDPFWAHDFEVSYPDGDNRNETMKHVEEVRRRLTRVIDDLTARREVHDASKFESPEREIFQEMTAKLAGSTYGSEEYKGYLAEMKPALDHHYAANSHHPEHFPDGIRGMSLLDVVEMLCDWKAATLRHNDGDIRRSIEINQKRFGYSDEMRAILLNTLAVIDA